MFNPSTKRGKEVTVNLSSSLGPRGQVLPEISGFPFARPSEAASDLPGIPFVGASIILIRRLECELAFCEAFKDSLCSHLNL